LEIVTDLLQDLHDDPVAREVSARSLGSLAIVSEQNQGIEQLQISGLEVIPVPTPRALQGEMTDPNNRISPETSKYLAKVHGAIQNLFHSHLHPVMDAREEESFNVFVDLWVVGSLEEDFYRRSLFPLAVAIREIVTKLFEALFQIHGPLYNAAFHLMPIGTSTNLRGLKADDKREVVELICRLDRWNHEEPVSPACHGSMAVTRYPVIPRFYLLDGFTSTSMLRVSDQRRCIKNLLLMALCSGLRHREGFRNFFRFRDGGEDFLTVVTLATLEFPITLFRNYCVNHAIVSLVDYLLEEAPDPGDMWEMERRFEPIQDQSNVEKLQPQFLETSMGDTILDQIDEETPDFVHYYPEERTDLEVWKERIPAPQSIRLPKAEQQANPLREQGTFLPVLRRREDPETMAEFFDLRWLEHPEKNLACLPPSEVPRRYHAMIKDVNARGYHMAQDLVEDLGGAVDETLQAPGMKERVNRLARYLDNALCMPWAKLRKQQKEKLYSSLPPPPDTIRFQYFAGILRKKIWARPSIPILLFWVPVLIGLALVTLQHVLPNPGKWAVGVIPGMESFYPDDPLKYDPLREMVPTLIQLFLGALLLVTIPITATSEKVFRHLRRLTRSPLPHLAALRSMMQRSAEKGEELEEERAAESEVRKAEAKKTGELEKLAKKDRERMGLLGRELEELRDAFRIYWQARIQLSSDLWIYRVLSVLEKGVLEEIQRLQSFSAWLAHLRLAAIDQLRKLGDPKVETVDITAIPKAYPEESPYHALFLDNRKLPDFYNAYRGFDDDVQAVETLLRDYDLLGDWRTGGRLRDLMDLRAACESLFPALSKGPFTLTRYQERLAEQVRAFFDTLEGRLSGGKHFRYYASMEANAVVEDTGVVIIAPPDAMFLVRQAAKEASLDRLRIIGESKDPHRIYAFRMVRDVEVGTLARYLDIELTPPSKDPKDPSLEATDPWNSIRIQNLSAKETVAGDPGPMFPRRDTE